VLGLREEVAYVEGHGCDARERQVYRHSSLGIRAPPLSKRLALVRCMVQVGWEDGGREGGVGAVWREGRSSSPLFSSPPPSVARMCSISDSECS
jgi:hypothetical protein